MHEILWQRLDALDGARTAARAVCGYDAGQERYSITMLTDEYSVDPAAQCIRRTEGREGKKAGFLEQLCILSYLISARDVAPSGKLVKAQSLPAGQFFFRGIHQLPTAKLAAAFGDEPARLLKAAERLRGRNRDYGDAAVEINVLPKVPVTFVVWRGDKEYTATASILFDETAAEHMPLDALLAAANLAVEKVAG